MKPAHVFRLFDAAGNVLYIGLSTPVPTGRIATLKRREPWGSQVARWEIHECPTIYNARFLRAHLVREQRPIHGRPLRLEAVAA